MINTLLHRVAIDCNTGDFDGSSQFLSIKSAIVSFSINSACWRVNWEAISFAEKLIGLK